MSAFKERSLRACRTHWSGPVEDTAGQNRGCPRRTDRCAAPRRLRAPVLRHYYRPRAVGQQLGIAAAEPYHCKVSCVCFFLSFIICVMLFLADGLWSVVFSAPSRVSASSSPEESASLLKRVSERRRGTRREAGRHHYHQAALALFTGHPARCCPRGRAGAGQHLSDLASRRSPSHAGGTGACPHPTSHLI